MMDPIGIADEILTTQSIRLLRGLASANIRGQVIRRCGRQVPWMR
jgi:hypothetical protein